MTITEALRQAAQEAIVGCETLSSVLRELLPLAEYAAKADGHTPQSREAYLRKIQAAKEALSKHGT